MDYQAIITQLAKKLTGDWYFHAIKSQYPHFYLHDRQGLYLAFNVNEYGHKNPRISLCYADPSYNNQVYLKSVLKIGCSLDKGLGSITSDIEKRLLCELLSTKKLVSDLKEAKRIKQENQQARNNLISALSSVFNVDKHNYSRTYESYDLTRLNSVDEPANINVHHQGGIDDFTVKIQSISLEKLIKVANIILND